MWAMTNRHKGIAKTLLDHGASPDIRSSSGGTAFDFVQPGSDFSQYLHENGYNIGNEGFGQDFYDSGGFAQDRFEEEMAESELKRRMLMKESAHNLEVDLSTLGFDEQPEVCPGPSKKPDLADPSSLPLNSKKSKRNSYGSVVWEIKCLYFKKAISIEY